MLQLKSLLSLLDPRSQEVASAAWSLLGPAAQSCACVVFEPIEEQTDEQTDEPNKFRLFKLTSANPSGHKGKKGEDLSLIAQFDFRAIEQIGGILNLHLSWQYQSYQPKERGWNLLSLSSESTDLSGINLKAKLALPGYANLQVDVWRQTGQISSVLPKVDVALAMAAFYANGISYSPARAADPHYSHLLESAAKWFVLITIREKDLLDQATNRNLYVCISESDFLNKAFHKSQLIFA